MATEIEWGGPVEYVDTGHTIVIVDSLGTRARCVTCGWEGPERTGDEHAVELVVDDAGWHLLEEGLRCPPGWRSCIDCSEKGR